MLGAVLVTDPGHAYRPDIDGLRAIAVGSVVLFHAFPWLVPGGYVGVDVGTFPVIQPNSRERRSA